MCRLFLMIVLTMSLSGCLTMRQADYAEMREPMAIDLASAKYLYEISSAADFIQEPLVGASALAMKNREKPKVSLLEQSRLGDYEVDDAGEDESGDEYADWE